MTSPVQATTDHEPVLFARLSAEAVGSMFVVLVAVGVSIFSNPSSAPLPAALATGLTVTVAMLAFGHVSGGHFNPIITLGNLIAGRIRALAAVAYLAAQIIGSVIGAALAFVVVLTVPVLTDARAAFGSVAAGYGEHAAAQTQMAGVLIVEVVGSALLVAVFLGATAGRRAFRAVAPFAVGLCVAVLLQFGQVLGNLPFNPARATALAFFSPSWAVEGLWLFWVAPLMGAALAGLAFRGFADASAATSLGDDVPLASVSSHGDQHLDVDDTDDFQAEAEAEAVAVETGTVRKEAAADDARNFFDGKKG